MEGRLNPDSQYWNPISQHPEVDTTCFLQSYPFHYQFEKQLRTVMFPILTSAAEKDVNDYTEASPIIVDWNGTALRRKESFRSEIAFKYNWE
jgi:hypothetical protein